MRTRTCIAQEAAGAAPAKISRRRCGHSSVGRAPGERAHLHLLDPFPGTLEARRRPCAVAGALGGHHRLVEERPRAADAAHRLHRRAVEVADPHPHRHLGREAQGHVVAEALGRARLRRHREGQLQDVALPEGRQPRVLVREDVGDHRRLGLREHPPLRDCGERERRAVLAEGRLHGAHGPPHPAAGERGVGVGRDRGGAPPRPRARWRRRSARRPRRARSARARRDAPSTRAAPSASAVHTAGMLYELASASRRRTGPWK